MAWQDRLLVAAYTSPSGLRTTFDYEDLSREVKKKTAAFDFPDVDGTYIQDLGRSGRRYPIRVIIWGENYDTVAESFEDSLLERGQGRLEHPIFGSVDVVPFGSIKRRDDLKTAANQAIIEVVFFETTGLAYPSSQTDPGTVVLLSVDGYNTAASGEFGDAIDLDSAVERATFKSRYTSLLNNVKSGLDAVAETQENVQKQFNAVYDSINNGIDILIGDPLTLAFQTTLMIQSPARALTDIQARLDAYSNLARSIFSGNGAGSSNEFRTNDIYASTYVTGTIVSVVNNQFETRRNAIEAAEFILSLFDDLVTWRDGEFQDLGLIDTGAAYQRLQEAVAFAAGFLIEISFSLKQERIIVLDRARTIIDLAGELYGDVDQFLDLLIATNNLSGDEILELPDGREIVYYI